MEPGGRILDANPALVKMFGYPDKASFISRPAPEFYVNPQDREIFKKMVEGRRNGEPCEFQMRRFDRSLIWVEIQAITVRDEEGRTRYYESTLKDITERKLAEEALRESEENFRMVVEHSPVAIFCHTGGRFQYLNPSALKLFGADAPDQIVGRLVFDHIHPDSTRIVPGTPKNPDRRAQASAGGGAGLSKDEWNAGYG